MSFFANPPKPPRLPNETKHPMPEPTSATTFYTMAEDRLLVVGAKVYCHIVIILLLLIIGYNMGDGGAY